MAGLKALDIGFEWIKKFFTRKDEKREKDAGKATMAGDERTMRNITNRMYPDKK